MKVTVTIPDELLHKVDEQAAALYLNRSVFVTIALQEKLKSDSLSKAFPEAVAVLQEMLDKSKAVPKIED